MQYIFANILFFVRYTMNVTEDFNNKKFLLN